MRLLSNDINGIAVLNNWKTSGRLKDLFLNIIDSNLSNMNHLKSLHYNPEYNIEKEYDVILMKERTDSFKEELDNEIVLVGKE